MMLGGHLLSVVIWLPIAGGFAVLGFGDRVLVAKWLSLVVSAVTLLLSAPLYTAFKVGTAEMQFA
jgi:NADH-quinone oxidoreductase subunit M